MSFDHLLAIIASLGQALTRLLAPLGNAILSPGGSYALTSLLSALIITIAFWTYRRPAARRRLRWRVLRRALFPRRLLNAPSTRADVGMFLLNNAVLGALLGWALLSSAVVSAYSAALLTTILGAPGPTALPDWACMLILTVAIYLAHELGYFIDHFLSHKVPFLWEFHKVHHTAEILTPLTNARVHPVDSIVYYNTVALTMGLTGGVLVYLFGRTIDQLTLFQSNALMLVANYLLNHLLHSHVWIAFTGRLGRVLMSPAHHQIHHSADPRHFDKNLGSSLAIFDWLCGTLHVPSKRREALSFGVAPQMPAHHTPLGLLVTPFREAAGTLGALARRAGRNIAFPLHRRLSALGADQRRLTADTSER